MRTFLLYKAIRRIYLTITNIIDNIVCRIVFWGNNISYQSFKTHGIPVVSVAIGGSCIIGFNLKMNNGTKGNPIGCFERCTIFVDKGAKLIIGDNVGLSQTALVCHIGISIGNNVKIGGGVCIYDTDFHALDANLRANASTDFESKDKKPVILEDNVFIGAHSLILKGLTIGENSIIGAGSVVTKSVPANQIWAGNPAKFIRNL
jgi:acetyltransferase-like isoleucine patch superfamily enzyme